MASVVKNYALATAAAVNRALGHGCAIRPEVAAELETLSDFIGKMREQLELGTPFPGAQLVEMPWHNEQLGVRLDDASRVQLTHYNFRILVGTSTALLFFTSGEYGNPPLMHLRVSQEGVVVLTFINQELFAVNEQAVELLWDISRELDGHIVRQLIENWTASIPLPAFHA